MDSQARGNEIGQVKTIVEADRKHDWDVYPASAAEEAPKDSEAHGMASWGQGERGARGYYDHGESELHLDRTEEDQS